MAHRPIFAALLSVVILGNIGYGQSREQRLLGTSVRNTMRDVKSLPSLWFEQTMTSKWRVHEYGANRSAVVNPERQLIEKFETVIADGKVYRRCTERDGSSVDEKPLLLDEETDGRKAPDFLDTVLFGGGIPFEALPAEFKVVDVHHHNGRMTLDLRAINKKSKFQAMKVALEVDADSMRVLTAKYHISPDPQYASRHVELTFGPVRAYWLPVRIHSVGFPTQNVAMFEFTNEITYKKFEVKTAIIP